MRGEPWPPGSALIVRAASILRNVRIVSLSKCRRWGTDRGGAPLLRPAGRARTRTRQEWRTSVGPAAASRPLDLDAVINESQFRSAEAAILIALRRSVLSFFPFRSPTFCFFLLMSFVFVSFLFFFSGFVWLVVAMVRCYPAVHVRPSLFAS